MPIGQQIQNKKSVRMGGQLLKYGKLCMTPTPASQPESQNNHTRREPVPRQSRAVGLSEASLEMNRDWRVSAPSWLPGSKPANQCHLTSQAGVWTQWHRCVGGTSWTGCRRSVKTSGPLGRRCVKPHLLLFYLYGNETLMFCQGHSCHSIKPMVANWIKITWIVKTIKCR